MMEPRHRTPGYGAGKDQLLARLRWVDGQARGIGQTVESGATELTAAIGRLVKRG
ncbi:hypothetical protein ACFFWC_18970 [Plantactinospora siamensis]|uniref:Uncharacterized protein n=1 Tax=Plantactinospora siamensis TaxID=555372 RepID=A0ABV6P3C7_9ACTN